MTDRAWLDEWRDAGGRPQTDLERRLIRRVPEFARTFDKQIEDPIERALLGLEAPEHDPNSLADRIRLGVAGRDYGAQQLRELEEEARDSGDPHLWIMAARLHAEKSIEREASARMALSEQALPYVFPGELHEMIVHLLATGERIIPALHVDWIRKLTVWVAPTLALDCKVLGLWFWPILQCLDARKLARPMQRLSGRSLPPGGLGLHAGYVARLGLPMPDVEGSFTQQDRVVKALFRLGDQVR